MRFRFYTLIALAVFLIPAFSLAQVRTIVFPVAGESSFRNDFSEPRGGGTREHLGIDILAPKMTPVVAAADGVISYIPQTEPSYGYMLTIQDKDGYQYRYIHLNNDTPGTDDGNGGAENAYVSGLKRGTEVTAGQHIGWVGDSGNAEQTVPHLHFEIRAPDRIAINPYESLLASASAENLGTITTVATHGSVGEVGVQEAAFVFVVDLKEGMEGDAIRELQSRLKTEGYFTQTTLTTYFGPITKAAVQTFQRANTIAPTGVAGFQTRTLLNENGGASPITLRLEQEMFEGTKGESVTQAQLKLKILGYDSGDADGVFDGELREAVRRFQNDNKLPTTGAITFDTWNKINEKYAASNTPVAGPTGSARGSYTFTRTLSVGSRGEDVSRLQCLLQTLSFFSARTECTGYFGPVTHDAVVAFQTSQGIEAIGIVGPKTRSALNAL